MAVLASLRSSCCAQRAPKLGMDELMQWNQEPITYGTALKIGWNLPQDVVGAGVYGGIVKRTGQGKIIIGDEWPEDNVAPPAHNPVHASGPYLDFSKFTPSSRGYTHIARLIQRGNVADLEALFARVTGGDAEKKKLANLVMTGGARPLHMCGMGRGGDTSEIIKVLLKYGADVNAKDNYELTPVDRLSSNWVFGNNVLSSQGGLSGSRLPRGVPDWASDEFDYTGPGETEEDTACSSASCQKQATGPDQFL